jgi:hypothetical protein
VGVAFWLTAGLGLGERREGGVMGGGMGGGVGKAGRGGMEKAVLDMPVCRTFIAD